MLTIIGELWLDQTNHNNAGADQLSCFLWLMRSTAATLLLICDSLSKWADFAALQTLCFLSTFCAFLQLSPNWRSTSGTFYFPDSPTQELRRDIFKATIFRSYLESAYSRLLTRRRWKRQVTDTDKCIGTSRAEVSSTNPSLAGLDTPMIPAHMVQSMMCTKRCQVIHPKTL